MFLPIFLLFACFLMYGSPGFGHARFDSMSNITLSVNDHAYAAYFSYTSTYTINVTSIPQEFHAIVVQAISQGGEVTVSLSKDFLIEYTTTGKSAGVITVLQYSNATSITVYAKVVSERNCSSNLSELIVISATGLSNNQPVPGGCNLVHPANYYPLLTTQIKNNIAYVRFSHANIGSSGSPDPLCDSASPPAFRLLYEIHLYFLPHPPLKESCVDCIDHVCQDGSDSIFAQEIDAIAVTNDKNENPILILNHGQKPKFLLAMSSCVVTMVAIKVKDPHLHTSSLYVPEAVFDDVYAAESINIVLLKVILILIMLLSLILCFAGQRFFPFELFMFGAVITVLISSLIFEACKQDSSLTQLAVVGIISGLAVVGGIVLVACWWRFGCIKFCCLLIGLVGGFLFSSIIFATPLINFSFLRSQTMFACLFVVCSLFYLVVLSVLSPFKLCIITSAFIGSYLTVLTLGSGVFFCSMTSQIIELVFSRITYSEFSRAVVVLPMLDVDFVLISVWVVLFIGGCVAQFYLQRNRPKFPECPYEARHTREQQQFIDCEQSEQASTSSSDSFSTLCASFTSEHYEGDVSDGELGETLRSEPRDQVRPRTRLLKPTETTPLITNRWKLMNRK